MATVLTRRRAPGSVFSLVVNDTFNRANATGLGVADSGQTWGDDSVGWDILSNQAVPRTTGTCLSVVESGATDQRVEATIAHLTSNPSLLARYADTTHYLRLQQASAALTLFQNNAGNTTLGTFSATAADGDVLRLDVVGQNATAYLNGVAVITAVTVLPTGTKVGLIASAATGNIVDNFKAYSVT